MAGDAIPLDWDKALGQACGDREFLCELVGLLLEDLEQRLPELRDAAAVGDVPRVRELAHAVKGAARNLGATALGEAAWALEQAPGVGAAGVAQVEAEGLRLRSALASGEGTNEQ